MALFMNGCSHHLFTGRGGEQQTLNMTWGLAQGLNKGTFQRLLLPVPSKLGHHPRTCSQQAGTPRAPCGRAGSVCFNTHRNLSMEGPAEPGDAPASRGTSLPCDTPAADCKPEHTSPRRRRRSQTSLGLHQSGALVAQRLKPCF